MAGTSENSKHPKTVMGKMVHEEIKHRNSTSAIGSVEEPCSSLPATSSMVTSNVDNINRKVRYDSGPSVTGSVNSDG